MADDLGWEPIPGVAGANGCPHPTRLLTPSGSRKRRKARQVDGASTAWVSNARAPLRRISVRESVKAPGWANLMTLLSDTAYHSFIGEVEALNTTTIRRLTRSRRHQLLAIAGQPHEIGVLERLVRSGQ